MNTETININEEYMSTFIRKTDERWHCIRKKEFTAFAKFMPSGCIWANRFKSPNLYKYLMQLTNNTTPIINKTLLPPFIIKNIIDINEPYFNSDADILIISPRGEIDGISTQNFSHVYTSSRLLNKTEFTEIKPRYRDIIEENYAVLILPSNIHGELIIKNKHLPYDTYQYKDATLGKLPNVLVTCIDNEYNVIFDKIRIMSTDDFISQFEIPDMFKQKYQKRFPKNIKTFTKERIEKSSRYKAYDKYDKMLENTNDDIHLIKIKIDEHYSELEYATTEFYAIAQATDEENLTKLKGIVENEKYEKIIDFICKNFRLITPPDEIKFEKYAQNY